MSSVRRPTPVVRRPVSSTTPALSAPVSTPTAQTLMLPNAATARHWESQSETATATGPQPAPPTTSLRALPTATTRLQLIVSRAPEFGKQTVQSITANANNVLPVISGAFVGLQAVLLTLGLTALVTIVAALGARGSSLSGWSEPINIATQLWLLSHGGVAKISGVPMELIPLGLTFFYLLLFRSCILRASIKRKRFGKGAALSAILSYAFLAMFVSNMASQQVAQNLSAGLGGILVAAIGVLWVFAKPVLNFMAAQTLWHRWWANAIRAGLLAASAALLATVGVGALLVATWALLGRDATVTAVSELAPGAVGGVILGVGQLAFVPNWLIWATAWLAGPGFAIGQNTIFAPGQHQSGPLPALPLFATLPPVTWSGQVAAWLPALFLLVGVLAGWVVWKRSSGWLVEVGVGMAIAVVVAAGGMALLQHLTAGSLGAGRMLQIGANPLLVAGSFGGELLLGCLVVLGSQVASIKWAARQQSVAIA